MFTCAHDLQITYDREICALLGELLLRHLYAQERLHLDLDVEVHPGILEEAEAELEKQGGPRLRVVRRRRQKHGRLPRLAARVNGGVVRDQ